MRGLGRALPAWIARDAFEPAWCDLHIDFLHERSLQRGSAARLATDIRHTSRVLLLFLDCWRLAITGFHRRPAGLPTPRALPTQERSTVFLYHLRHALRRLVREPAFTTAAVLTLALGVGANLAVFAVVEAVLLRPLPYSEAEALVVLNHRDHRTGITKQFIALGDYVDLNSRQTAFSAFGGYSNDEATFYTEGDPYRVHILQTTAGAFEALRITPVLGRGMTREDSEETAGPVVVLGHALWQERFGGDTAIIGRTIRINQLQREVIGIAPPGFRFLPNTQTDAILSSRMPASAPAGRKNAWIFAVGRLKDGLTAEAATSNMTTISRQLEAEYPETNAASSYFTVPLRDAMVGDTKPALLLLLAAVVVVLLIACTNVSNLLLARALSRRREMALRMALGARRGRLTLQLLTESAVLAIVASAGGILIAHWGARALVTLVPASVSLPGLSDVEINGAVLLFALLLTVLTTLAFSTIAALTIKFERGTSDLMVAGRASMSALARRATSGLVVAEIAFAVVLLVGAGLILRSFAALVGVNPGFQPDNVLTMQVAFPADRYPAGAAQRGLYDRVFASLRSRPEVREAGVAVVTPLTGNNWTIGLQRPERPLPPGERPPEVGWQVASGSYFKALQIPLISGRVFDPQIDNPESPPVVIISDALARQYFAGESAVGKFVQIGDGAAEIVGVVGSIRRAALTEEPRAEMYLPFERGLGTQITFFIRTSNDPLASLTDLQRAVKAVEPSTVFLASRTLADVAAESMRVTRLVLWLLGIFATTALVLAGIGIFAVMSYVVRQRTREIGTRMALGASRGGILLMVMRQGSVIAAAGTAIGLLAGLLAARSLQSLLFGVSGADPIVLIGSTLVLGACAMLACYFPARRAASVDPARTLVEQ
jgi:putative ABC transport system permease protein